MWKTLHPLHNPSIQMNPELKSSVNTKSQKSTLNPKMLQYFSFPEKLFLTNQFSFKTFRMNLSLLFWCMHVYEHVYKWKCVSVCVLVYVCSFIRRINDGRKIKW